MAVELGIDRVHDYDGSNFVSPDPCRAHFGLGDANHALGIAVRWPDGEQSVVRGPVANQTLEVVLGTVLIDGFETGDFSGWELQESESLTRRLLPSSRTLDKNML